MSLFELKSQYLKPKSKNPKPETRNPKPETRNPVSAWIPVMSSLSRQIAVAKSDLFHLVDVTKALAQSEFEDAKG
jgi:hypothetical protein